MISWLDDGTAGQRGSFRDLHSDLVRGLAVSGKRQVDHGGC